MASKKEKKKMRIVVEEHIGKLETGVKFVKLGFGNYLINNGYAKIGTPYNIMIFNQKKEDLIKKQIERAEKYNEIINLIKKRDYLFCYSPVNSTGNFYGSLGLQEIKKELVQINPIFEAIKSNNMNLDRKMKNPGLYTCNIIFPGNIKGKLSIIIAEDVKSGEKIKEEYESINKKIKKENI